MSRLLMTELLEEMDKKKKDDVMAVSISASLETYNDCIKQWEGTTEGKYDRQTMKVFYLVGIPMHVAKDLKKGYIVHWSNGFSTSNNWKEPVCERREPLYKPMKADDVEAGKIFVQHIQSHLQPTQEVICKICGKTISQIWKEEKVKE